MINQSRLAQVNPLATTRSNQDDFKSLDKMGSALEGGTDLGDAGVGAGLAGSAFPLAPSSVPGTNSFSQLLEMSKLDKPDLQAIKKPATEKQSNSSADKQTNASDKSDDDSNKKTNGESNSTRRAAKTKDKKSDNAGSDEQILSQLLTAQQAVLKPNEMRNQNNQVQQLKATDINKSAVGSSDQLSATDKLAQLGASTQFADNDNGPKSITDVMKTLDQKIDHLSTLQNSGHVEQANTGNEKLNEIASKFDDVKFEFNPNENNATLSSKVVTGALTKDLQARELAKQLAEQEWAQNDLALRDLVANQNMQELALEKFGLDRFEQLSLLKNAQADKLQMQDLQAAAALKQLQVRDAQATAQPQWQSYRDLSPEQKAMVDALSGGQSLQNMNSNMNGGAGSSLAQGSLANRLMPETGKVQQNTTPLTQDAVAGLQSLSSLSGEQTGGSQGQQNSSSNSSRGETSAVGGIGGARMEQTKGRTADALGDESNTARTRENERAREMARSAALRAQSIASELSAKGGGTAKVQIKDSQLGVVELRINMADNNRVSVELIANSDRIKNELEKQTDDLKLGLEKHKVVLEGVKFATDTKLGDSGFQNSSQNDNSRANQQQQQQQQQSFSSFSQGNNSNSQQSFGGGERFFEAPRTPAVGNVAASGSVKKNYSGKNDAQTNVQRAANGSLKVTA